MVLNWRSQWAIEPCELHRVYPPLADDPGTGNGTEERGVTGGEPALAEASTRATLAEARLWEKMLWGGGENLAFIGADLNRWSTPCKS
jgi:hypothetical protein